MKAKPQPAEWKKKKVAELKELILKYPVIGVVNMENLPALQLRRMRFQLRDKILMFMTKKRLIKIAFNDSKDKKNIEKMNELIRGMPALIFTKESPFKLSSFLKKNKSKAFARAGQTAPNNIVVPAGPTPFAPGPVISELASVGIKTNVVGGKVNIIDDTVVVKEGDAVNSKVAGILTRLGIEPMEIGLDMVCAYENGIVYDKKVLAVDEDYYLENLRIAYNESIAVAMEIGYLTKETVEILVKKAFNGAKALSVSQGFFTEENIKEMVVKADTQASSLKDNIGGN